MKRQCDSVIAFRAGNANFLFDHGCFKQSITSGENLMAMVHLEDHGHSFWSVSLSIAVGFSFHGALETSLPQVGLKVIFRSLSQASTLTLSKNKMVATYASKCILKKISVLRQKKKKRIVFNVHQLLYKNCVLPVLCFLS